ncbi:muts domain V-domain-containing protein [Parasitella parasitica]|nr:muts domain V-domain-containing protein [Parasitella parasitica]
MVAVQPSTGDIIYDAFDDTYMRTELETRLLHIEPIEILVPRVLSKPTEKLVKHLSLQKSTSFGEESVRIERMSLEDTFCSDYNAALTFASDFYATTSSLPQVVELAAIVIKALACTIRYLDEFELTSTLRNAKFFKHFISANHMLLNGNTLVNLEIYRNNTNFTEKGSLFSILNHTKTKFGQRLLRKWVGRPLVNINRLNERVDAIEELAKTDNPKKNMALSLFMKLPDIEKGLCRIHYGRSTPKELIQVLDALMKVSTAFQKAHEPRFDSDLLNRLFDTLPTIHYDVVEFRDAINPNYSGDNKVDLFRSEERWPEIPKQKKNIKYVEVLLEDHLVEMKTVTRMNNLKFAFVSGIEYLIEVPNTCTKKVPNDWIKISGTKAVSRYHNKYIMDQLKEREQYRELLFLAAEKAYTHFLAEISEKYEHFRDVVSCLAHLDCLVSLTITASQSDYVKPAFNANENETTIKVIEGRHPIVERLTRTFVPNDILFDGKQKAMILTGPNMGGKSSYIRQIALIAIMGQIGSYVPAKSATLSVLDAVYTRMGATDNMMRGESTFMVELHETSDIMKQATAKSLVILDELGRGTSTHDGQAIAYAVLKHFVQQVKSTTLFVTHYPSLGKLVKTFPGQVRNCYMSYIEDEDGSDLANIVFLYKLVDGIAMNSYG